MIDDKKIKKALEAKIPASDLNTEEQVIYFNKLYDSMWVISPEQETRFLEYIKTH